MKRKGALIHPKTVQGRGVLFAGAAAPRLSGESAKGYRHSGQGGNTPGAGEKTKPSSGGLLPRVHQ